MGDVGFNNNDEDKETVFWRNTMAEVATRNIISKFQPTPLSENRRKDVILYVQRLIKRYLGCEVFPYGSVPLKTYLPDGDIDLTAFVNPNLEEALANDVVSVLQSEEQNGGAEFIVKDVQLIRAEVKIVKCIVQNIVVDISFNQLGGLCTLCFLEQVNRVIGKDHLFKRSIILVKAWCYYESRILGAHHALISTYALETLVLYIFHFFHTNLDGPLAVLYKFLDYFSKFDWDNYCVSLNGPVRISSLPEIVDKKLENGDGNFLLSDEFLKNCMDMFSVPSKGVDNNSRTLPLKNLNIIDPLRGNNNLGRSVSKGNLFRIRSAFAYGARKLRQALSQEEDSKIAEELAKFLLNTLDRHGTGRRPDIQDVCGGSNSVSTNDNYDEVIGNTDEIELLNFKLMLTEKDENSVRNTSGADADMVAVPHFAPHLFFSKSKENGNSDGKDSCKPEEKSLSVSSRSENDCHENSFCDLNGDYESHFNSLKYGRFCYNHSLSVPAPLPPPLPPHLGPYPYKRNGLSNMHIDNVGIVPRPGFFPNNPMVLVNPLPPSSFGMVEEFPKQRGTGTYIPNVNRAPYRYNHSMGRREINEQGAASKSPHNSPHYASSFTPFQNIDDMIEIDDTIMTTSNLHLRRYEVNNVPHHHHVLENRTIGGQQIAPAPSAEDLPPQELQSSSPALPVSSKDNDTRRRVMEDSEYRLKNEADFPPLSM